MRSVNWLMIGIGICLIALGFVGIRVSNVTVRQQRNNFITVAERAGDSIATFEVSLLNGRYSINVLNVKALSDYPQYRVFDSSGKLTRTLELKGTEESMEWQSYKTGFVNINPGNYTFELHDASPSSADSFMRLTYIKRTIDYLHPYQSLLGFGIASITLGIISIVIAVLWKKRVIPPQTPKVDGTDEVEVNLLHGNYNLDVVVKIFAVGIPAFLIVFGFFAYIGGCTAEIITGDVEMKNLGTVLMAIGIIIYVIELIAAIYYQFS